MIRSILIFGWVMTSLGTIGLLAQPADSAAVLNQEEYFDWVIEHHPYALQAGLVRDEAAAVLRKARGGFDPKLEGAWDQKYFEGKSYYHLAHGGFKIPTWYGLEVKGGYGWSDGVFLNPEQKLPAIGQASFGISANLLQGLFIDKRRADLQKAKIFQQASEAERRELMNDLLMTAGEAYWAWTLVYNELLLYRQAFLFSQQRFEGVRESFMHGDQAAIDTLESWIQVQNWENQLVDAGLKYQKASLNLSNFLWLEQGIPLEVTDRIKPPLLADLRVFEPSLESLAVSQGNLNNTQAALQAYRFKLASLEVDRKLKMDKLKPVLRLEYYLLGNGLDFGPYENSNGGGLGQLFGQNYKLGATFSFPLFLRKERGDVELANLKITENRLQLQQKELEWSNKLESYFLSLQNIADQIRRLEQMVVGYRSLLAAENEKFNIGESSIFLLNSREQKLLDAQLKLAKMRSRWQKSQLGMDWARGVLSN